MIILGLNAYHGDSSAVLISGGRIIAAVEEERFLRFKHWAGFPEQAIRCCLSEAGVKLSEIDVIAVNRDPSANVLRKVLFSVARRPGYAFIRDRLKNAARIGKLRKDFEVAFPEEMESFRGQIRNVQHHVAHLASAYYLSGYEEAAVCSVDGFGDFVSTMTALGSGTTMKTLQQVHFPHSLGLFYLAFTQFLGFPKYGDEYKVMGLSAYGKPSLLKEMTDIIQLKEDGTFRLNLEYFIHHSEGVTMTWDGGEPQMGAVYSKNVEETFGPARRQDEPVDDRHKDIAASLQARYEECFFHILDHLHKATGSTRLTLAGGCAQNSLANGKIFERSPFREVFIQPAAGDAGGGTWCGSFRLPRIGQERTALPDGAREPWAALFRGIHLWPVGEDAGTFRWWWLPRPAFRRRR